MFLLFCLMSTLVEAGSCDEMANGGSRNEGGNRYASVAAVLFEAEICLQSARECRPYSPHPHLPSR